MERFYIKGPTPKGVLGSINCSGAKNAALPLMASSILFERTVILKNIPLVNENSIPNSLKNNKNKICIIGLTAEPNRLVEVRKNRMSSLKDNTSTNYVNFEKISQEVEEAKKTVPCIIEVQKMLLDWESGDKEVVELWTKMNTWV